jgi:hypothetical protein
MAPAINKFKKIIFMKREVNNRGKREAMAASHRLSALIHDGGILSSTHSLFQLGIHIHTF